MTIFSHSSRIPRAMKQAASLPIFERQARTVTAHDGRHDLTKRLCALRRENELLRRQAADLVRHNENLRMRTMPTRETWQETLSWTENSVS
jgi:hypothetical protein